LSGDCFVFEKNLVSIHRLSILKNDFVSVAGYHSLLLEAKFKQNLIEEFIGNQRQFFSLVSSFFFKLAMKIFLRRYLFEQKQLVALQKLKQGGGSSHHCMFTNPTIDFAVLCGRKRMLYLYAVGAFFITPEMRILIIF